MNDRRSQVHPGASAPLRVGVRMSNIGLVGATMIPLAGSELSLQLMEDLASVAKPVRQPDTSSTGAPGAGDRS
jgi:hypothetical protein